MAETTRQLIEQLVDLSHRLRVQYELEHGAPEPPPPATDVIRVRRGEDIAAAVQRGLAEGKNVVAEPGVYHTRIVVKPGAQRSILLTSDTTNLPKDGQRITREWRDGLVELRSADGLSSVVEYEPGATGLNLTGVCIGPQDWRRAAVSFGTDQLRARSDQPHDIVWDRVLMLGDPERGQLRGMMLHARNFALLNSSLLDYHAQGMEGQCIGAWNGGQQLTFRNNHFEAGSINMLFGGGRARTPEMAPQDILIEGCHFSKNPKWMSGMQFPPTVKTLFELKHAHRVTVRHCLFEHNWKQAWANAPALVIKCADQHGDEPWTVTKDVLIEECVVRRVGQFLAIVGKDDETAKQTGMMERLTVRWNLAYEIGIAPFSGTPRLFQCSNIPHDLRIEHNTVLGNGNFNAAGTYWFNQPIRGQRMAFLNNLTEHGAYGFHGPNGLGTLGFAVDIPDIEMRGNAFMRHPDRVAPLPAGNALINRDAFTGSLDSEYRVRGGSALDSVVTTDGAIVGADIDGLRERVPAAF